MDTNEELEQLRENSARLAAIRRHIEPKWWGSRYTRNELLDDLRALADGRPVESAYGVHYFAGEPLEEEPPF